MENRDDDSQRSSGEAARSVSLRGVALFAVIWFGLLWLLITGLAAHAYRVGEVSSFRYVAF